MAASASAATDLSGVLAANLCVVGSLPLDPLINAHTDFQTALKEIQGTQSQALASDSGGSEVPARRLATSKPGKSVAALAEAAIEKALANGHSQDNKEC